MYSAGDTMVANVSHDTLSNKEMYGRFRFPSLFILISLPQFPSRQILAALLIWEEYGLRLVSGPAQKNGLADRIQSTLKYGRKVLDQVKLLCCQGSCSPIRYAKLAENVLDMPFYGIHGNIHILCNLMIGTACGKMGKHRLFAIT